MIALNLSKYNDDYLVNILRFNDGHPREENLATGG